jgi:hypothetical protein
MVMSLEVSAVNWHKRERRGLREMAKQVAHEIKTH